MKYSVIVSLEERMENKTFICESFFDMDSQLSCQYPDVEYYTILSVEDINECECEICMSPW